MRPVRACLVLAPLLLLPIGGPVAEKAGKQRAMPTVLDRLPKDPLLVTVMSTGNLAELLDDWRDLAVRFSGGEIDESKFDAQMAELDQKLGCSLRDDLLARIGPEVGVVVDLPPIDSLMVGAQDPTAIPGMLTGLGLVARVQPGERLQACLRKLLTMETGQATEEDGMVRIAYPLPGPPTGQAGGDEPVPEGAQPQDGPSLSVYYAIRDGVLALGVAPVFVRSSLAPREKGQRLTDGEDFKRVFSHLDAAADDLSYFNLPKLREMARSSQMVQSVVQSENEAKFFLDFLLDPEITKTGAGSTSREMDSGTRTTSFGPSLFSGSGTAATGIVAAIAIPNLLNAIDRGKQKRTMADIRTVGTVCEEFAIDHNRYPGPTDGWVTVDAIASEVESVYIRTLPRTDSWGHQLRFWSDGEGYRIVSPGKDGGIDAEWSGEVEGGPTTNFSADIVFADGYFVQWPEGTQQ